MKSFVFAHGSIAFYTIIFHSQVAVRVPLASATPETRVPPVCSRATR